MILAIDTGNTNIVLGCIENRKIRAVARMATDVNKTDYEYAVGMKNVLAFAGFQPESFEGAILSNVVWPLTSTLCRAVKLLTGLDTLVVGKGLKTGLDIRLDDPGQIGADLVVGAVAAVLFVPYVAARVASFRDPFSDLTGDGWQIVQSLYAIGSGGLSGLGLGMSRQKYLYLPEEHNDFIFSVVCEELGFIGASAILLLFAMLIVRGYWISLQSTDRFSFLTGCGITTMLALQIVLNVAVCTNLVPCTGISLPFFSYGGTALLIQMGEAGILLSISRENPCAAYAPRELCKTVKNQKIEE